jgi:hypothetical protein
MSGGDWPLAAIGQVNEIGLAVVESSGAEGFIAAQVLRSYVVQTPGQVGFSWTAHYAPNPNFEEEMQEALKPALLAAAEDIKRHADPAAEAVGAPWMERKGHETIEVGEDADGVYVANTDYAGHLIEWGSVNNPPHAVLRSSARAAGLRLEETT